MKIINKTLIYLINMIIIICYYIFIYKIYLYINREVVTTFTLTMEKSIPTEVPNIWYKFIIDDFFSKFTIKSKTIDQKYFEMKSFTMIEHNQDNLKNSILCNIRSDHINSLVLECESYKEKISKLEIQVYYTRMIHSSLINDLHEILKDVEKWRK